MERDRERNTTQTRVDFLYHYIYSGIVKPHHHNISHTNNTNDNNKHSTHDNNNKYFTHDNNNKHSTHDNSNKHSTHDNNNKYSTHDNNNKNNWPQRIISYYRASFNM